MKISMQFVLLCIALRLTSLPAVAQTLSNAALSGRHYFRHILFESDASGAITLASSVYGSMNFDGQGRFTFQGQQVIGPGTLGPVGGSGTYQVQPSGFVILANPQRSTLRLNARLGVKAITGSSTEAPANVNDLFIAIPAPTTPVSNSSLLGAFQVATLEVPSGNASQVRNTLFRWIGNGQGGFDPIQVTGHAANLGSQLITQTITGAAYTIAQDGSATAVFPFPPVAGPMAALLGGRKALFISSDNNLIIGASMDPGGHDLLVAVRSLPGPASNSSLQGIFFTAGLAIAGGLSSSAGSANSSGNGTILFTRRFHSSRGTLDFTGAANYSVSSDGTGTLQMLRTAVGAAGAAFLSAAVNELDPGNFELNIAIQAPAFSGGGVFVSPIGVVNAASFAPAGSPLAPGQLFTIFGSGLAPQSLSAGSFPLPLQLAGVQVLVNNNAVPVRAVSQSQVSAVVPFSASGSRATIAVNNNGQLSNTVEVPLARTAPGVFTLGSSGSGAGAVHSDFSLVTPSAPARRGETVLIYLTGLGATSPPIGDGLPAPSSPLSLVISDVTVLVGGRTAAVLFKGLAPGFAALYQLNVTIPNDAPSGPNVPLAISTPEAFHDQAQIAIQ